MYFAGFGRPGQDPPPDGHGVAGVREDREQYAGAEGILHAAGAVGERQTGDSQQFVVDPGLLGEGVPVVGRPAELELPGDVAMQPTATQVFASGPRRRVVEQALVVPVDRHGHRLDEALSALALGCLPRRRVLELHADLGGEVLDGADEVDVTGSLDERDGVTRLIAAEAAVPPDLLTDVERRRLLGVKRAQPDEVAPDLAQRHDLADDVDERHHRLEPVDVFVADRHAGRSARRSALVAHRVVAGDVRVGGGIVVECVVHRFGHRLVAVRFVGFVWLTS